MRKSVLLSFVLILIFSTAIQGTTRYIKVDGSGDQSTIQAGIDASSTGDTVLVGPGTFTGTGNRDINFSGKAIVVMSEMGTDSTIIDCQGSFGDEHRGFNFTSGEDSLSVLQGFTIMNGYYDNGGGIHCVDSSPTIHENVITSCYNGGIYCNRTFTIIKNNLIYDNSAGFGGGIYCLEDTSAITGNEILNNWSNDGGGIWCSSSLIDITGNVIKNNNDPLSSAGGGIYLGSGTYSVISNRIEDNQGIVGIGIYCTNSDVIIRYDTLQDNRHYPQSGGPGGGIYCYGGNCIIEHNIITGNSGGNGGGISLSSPDTAKVRYNQIIGNDAIRMGPCKLFESRERSLSSNSELYNPTQGIAGCPS
ncbi:MAG: right-handed parallel beta-helix repeat-containing protein [bacterium]|nr:MAG: right-handed parallel beta-helix repeat-containing protein [bacterium]